MSILQNKYYFITMKKMNFKYLRLIFIIFVISLSTLLFSQVFFLITNSNLNQIIPTSQPGIMNIQQQQPSAQMPQMQQQQQQVPGVNMGLLAANEALGGSFGSSF